jgi:exonuclease SbcC
VSDVRILGVYLENIRSHKRSTIIFPLRGVTVIYGDVGSGKTSLLMGVEFALLGLQPGGFERSLFDAYKQPQGSDLLRVDSSSGRVRLLVRVGNKLYAIERRIVKMGDRYDATQGSVEEYVIEGDAIKPVPGGWRRFTSRSEMDDYIIGILGVREKKSERGRATPLVFTTALYVPQFNVHEVLALDKQRRVEIIERSLGLDKYKAFRANRAKIKEAVDGRIKGLSEVEQHYERVIREAKVEDLLKQRAGLEQELKDLEEELETLSTEGERLKKLQEEIEASIDKVRERVKEIEQEFKRFEELKRKLQEVEASLRGELESVGATGGDPRELLLVVEAELSKVEEERSKLRVVLSSLEAYSQDLERRLRGITESIERLNGEIGRLQGEIEQRERRIKERENERLKVEEMIKSGLCPVCRQRVTHEHGLVLLEEIESEIERERSELAVAKSSLEALQQRILELNKAREEIERKRKELQEERSKLLGRLDELNAQVTKLSIKREHVLSLVKSVEEIRRELEGIRVEEMINEKNKLESEIDTLRKRLDEVEVTQRELLKKLEELNRLIGSKKAELDNVDKRIKEVEDYKKKLLEVREEKRRLEDLKKTLEVVGEVVGEVENAVMRLIVSEFRRFFYEYLNRLLRDQPLEVVVTDDFGLVRKIKVGTKSYEVSSLSGGQNIAISLAYRLALNRVVREYSPSLKRSVLILDEPTTGFSPDVVKRLKQLLKEISGVESQAIIVTHDEELVEAGDCKIRFTLDPVEHKTNIEYEECAMTPEYRELVEKILLYGAHGLQGRAD